MENEYIALLNELKEDVEVVVKELIKEEVEPLLKERQKIEKRIGEKEIADMLRLEQEVV